MTGLWRTIAFYVSAVLVGVLLGWFLHGKPAPSPAVKVAKHHADVTAAAAQQAVAIATAANDSALHAIAQYHAARARDTVVVDSVVYVAAAPADAAVRKCADAIPKDTIALVRQDTALVAQQVLVRATEAAQPSRFQLSAAALYDPIARAPIARAETSVRITKHLAAIADAERGIGPTDSLRVHVGARWTF